MRRLYALGLVVLLAACSNMLATIKTGYDTADRYTQQTTAALNAGTITPAQAQQRSTYIKDAKACLDNATTTVAHCPQPPTADNCPGAQVAITCADAALAKVLGTGGK